MSQGNFGERSRPKPNVVHSAEIATMEEQPVSWRERIMVDIPKLIMAIGEFTQRDKGNRNLGRDRLGSKSLFWGDSTAPNSSFSPIVSMILLLQACSEFASIMLYHRKQCLLSIRPDGQALNQSSRHSQLGWVFRGSTLPRRVEGGRPWSYSLRVLFSLSTESR
jgi:hypothetical protein